MPRVISQDAVQEITALCKRYPTRLAVLLPALHRVQAELGHISPEAELDVAELLDVPPTRVREVVTFYTMFHPHPVGRHVVKICRNLACQLRGAARLLARAKEKLGIELGHTTPDGRITLEQEECLASCGTAPMLWCDGRFVENLSEEKLDALLAELP
ncbi:MAG: NAD(P)H-dependent oxidoreductase subunit E [Deltaproteobacteria bacterium]|nr:NAD(P)H-dependent oxidoreductase subunit E [Deltaproteobacteria bacterium]